MLRRSLHPALGCCIALDGLRHLQTIEAELAGELGVARMQALHEGLTALLAVLERECP